MIGRSNIAGNAVRRRHLAAVPHSRVGKRMRTGNYHPQFGFRIWHPSNGISFASEQQPLYPVLDQSRFLHAGWVDSSQGQAAPLRLSEDEMQSVDESFAPPERDADTRTAVEVPLPPAEATGDSAVGSIKDSAGDSPQGPPYTTLSFKIQDEAFRAAQRAEPGTPQSFWSYSLYRGPGDDGAETKVKVHYCRSKHTFERVCQQYFKHEKLLGFDLEWFPSATKAHGPRMNVSVIQLATETRVALFHIALFAKNDELVAPTFKEIMEDPDIRKIGVNIKGDCTRLWNWMEVKAQGVFELSHLYKLVKYSANGQTQLINKRVVALADQVREHLHLPMFKGSDVRSSDWSQPLTADQVLYSASDAYAAVQLFNVLDNKRLQLAPTPPLPHHSELNLPIRLADGAAVAAAEPSAAEQCAETDATEPEVPGRGHATSASSLQAARTNLELEYSETREAIEEVLTATAPPRKPAKAPAQARPADPRVLAADEWLAAYRAARPTLRSAPAPLRAYRIWHANGDLGPHAIAALLRDPPLRAATVAGYILQAIASERLPFERRRLLDEVVPAYPAGNLWRYRSLVGAVSGQVGDGHSS